MNTLHAKTTASVMENAIKEFAIAITVGLEAHVPRNHAQVTAQETEIV